MAKKITKKEIEQPDKFQEALQKSAKFISENKSKIYLITGIVTSALLIASGWYLYRMNYEKNAQKLFAKAYLAGFKGGESNTDQSAIKLYQDVVSQYPGTKAAQTAHYQMGNLYYNRGDIDSSIMSYQNFLKGSPDDGDLVTLTYIGLGYCYESKKDFKSALEYFENSANTIAAKNFESIIYRNIGRIHEELGNQKMALEYYQKALDKTSDPSIAQLLKRKISTLS